MTAEELLATAEPLAEDGTYCTIDPETRLITIPPEYQLLGVENDKKVERIYFQCPKIVGDNQDLSQDYLLFINYVNANGDPDAYKINDMQVDGDNITFSWLLEEKVTLYQGNIQISFFGIIPGDEQDDPDKNRWGTTINTDCTVLTGLKCTQQVAESNPDALAQIWAAIDELKAGGGGGGTPGKDGREIEIRNNGTAIQWRYVGDESWTDLVQLSSLKGEKGDKGDKGDTGETGPQGPAGETGPQGPVGPAGNAGATPNIQIGAVQTLDPGQPATANMSGTSEKPVLNLGIPKGIQGDQGPAGTADIPRQEMQNTDTTVTLQPNILYVFPEMASLTVTLGTPSDSNIVNEWHWFFDSGETACVFTLQNQDGSQVYTDAYSIEANMKYEVSILENVAYIKGVSTGAA